MFKHPMPANFFRTMEDASGMDLDWFWRGWFFGTDHVDITIENVMWCKTSTGDPKLDKAALYEKENRKRQQYTPHIRNAEEIAETAVEKDESLKDFYDKHNPKEVYALDQKEYQEYLASLTEEEKTLLTLGHNYYEIDFANVGGDGHAVNLKICLCGRD